MCARTIWANWSTTTSCAYSSIICSWVRAASTALITLRTNQVGVPSCKRRTLQHPYFLDAIAPPWSDPCELTVHTLFQSYHNHQKNSNGHTQCSYISCWWNGASTNYDVCTLWVLKTHFQNLPQSSQSEEKSLLTKSKRESLSFSSMALMMMVVVAKVSTTLMWSRTGEDWAEPNWLLAPKWI